MSVRIENLSKHFGIQKAVDRISFEVTEGKILGFLGPNGAGKSTTMKMATGYLMPTEGEVWVEGLPVTREPLRVKEQIGYLPEHNPMYLDMYVREFLDFVGRAYGLSRAHRRTRVDEMIDICGLADEQHKKIRMLSKGYRQRVGLAKALTGDPRVLILDEPTSGLDPNQLLEIRSVIRDIAREKTVILSTHIMQEVEALCEDVVIIHKGHIVANQSLSELRRQGKSAKVRVTFDETVEEDAFAVLEDVSCERVSGTEYIFASERPGLRSDILAYLSARHLPVSGIQDAGGSLEEIFHTLTRKETAS